MDKVEARAVLLDQVIDPLRQVSYRVEGEVLRLSASSWNGFSTAPSGRRYYVEVQGFWDNGKPGPFRLMAGIDDGDTSALAPLCEDFIKDEDESFVGE